MRRLRRDSSTQSDGTWMAQLREEARQAAPEGRGASPGHFDLWIARLRDRWFGEEADDEPQKEAAPASVEVPDTWLTRLRDRWFGDPEETTDAEASGAESAAEEPLMTKGAEFEELCALLRQGREGEQVQAAAALADHGAAAVEPLIEALEFRSLRVRCAAADALGVIGDQRAVQPLMEALRRCFLGGSGRLHRFVGLAGFLALSILVLGLFSGVMVLKAFGLMWVFVQIASGIFKSYLKKARSKGPLVRSITGALAGIAERSPTPELRSAVADLKAVAADGVQQDRQTRETSREAAEKIEALTERIKSLPLTATAPGTDLSHLPLPSEPAEVRTEDLPRVRT